LIGFGLPLFAGYMGQLSSGLAFARAYGWHSLGAALTVLLVEFWLFRLLGLQATVFVIASLNLLVAALLRLGYGELRQYRPPAGHYIKLPVNQLLALALLSIASAVYQLWLVKIAELVLGPFRETFAMVLALVLLGIALGTWLVKQFRIGFADVVLANLFGLVWLVFGFEMMGEAFASLYSQAVESDLTLLLLKLGLLAVLGGLPAISFGATIPALITTQDNVARESGQLLFISSVANALGFLLMIFVLHEHLSYGVLLIAIAALSALGLVVYRRGRPLAIALAGIVVSVMAFGQQTFWEEQFLYLGYDNINSIENLKKAKRETARIDPFKGPRDVFALNKMKQGDTLLFINGYHSMDLDMPYEQLVGTMSSIFSPRTDRALVLGVGSGATAGTVGLLFDQVDAVEINAVLLENLDRMRQYNFDLTQAGNVNIVHDDGIRFTKASEREYSLIINTVTTPRYFSSSKLYTLDFLQTVKQRLAPDGVYVTWFDSRIGDLGIDISLKTLSRVFEQCALSYMNAGYFLLLCSDPPLAMHQADKVAAQPELQQYLAENFHMLGEFLPYSLMTSNALPLLSDGEVAVNTLDFPVLEFEMARLKKHGFQDFSSSLIESMNIGDLETILATGRQFDPMMFVIWSDLALENNPLFDRWKSLLAPRYADFEQIKKESNLRYYRKVLATAAGVSAHYILATKLFEANLFEEALQQFTLAIGLGPEYSNVNFYLGHCLEKLGSSPDQAIPYYDKELELHPENEKALQLASLAYVNSGRPQAALALAERAVKIKGSAENYYISGLALARTGQKDEAREALLVSLRLSPGNQLVQKELAKLEGD